jgi:hypothetical protein
MDTAFVGHNNSSKTTQIHAQEHTDSAQQPAALELLGQQFKKRGDNCKRVTVLERRDGDVLALACRGVSAALSARYKSGLEARIEQHELILLHPHPTVPSYAATNPLTIQRIRHEIPGGCSFWMAMAAIYQLHLSYITRRIRFS